MRPPEPRRPDLLEQRLELAGGAAVAVDHDQLLVSRAKGVQLLAQLVDDARRIEVEERRDPVDVDVPAAPLDDVLHLGAQRPADDKRGPVQNRALHGPGPHFTTSLHHLTSPPHFTTSLTPG